MCALIYVGWAASVEHPRHKTMLTPCTHVCCSRFTPVVVLGHLGLADLFYLWRHVGQDLESRSCPESPVSVAALLYWDNTNASNLQ